MAKKSLELTDIQHFYKSVDSEKISQEIEIARRLGRDKSGQLAMFNDAELRRVCSSEFPNKTPVSIDEHNLTPFMRSNILAKLKDSNHRFAKEVDQNLSKLRSSRATVSAHYEALNLRGEAVIEDEAQAQLTAITKRQDNDSRLNILREETSNLIAKREHLRDLAGNRPPNLLPMFLYLILMLCVGGVEFLINYETFESKYVPALAFGFAILSGFGFALSGHMIGRFFKTLPSVRNKSVPPEDAPLRTFELFFGVLVGALAFGFVMWVRYTYFVQELADFASSLGSGGLFGDLIEAPSIFSEVAQTAGANAIAWVIGIIFSWIFHDQLPGYATTHQLAQKAEMKQQRYFRPYQSQEEEVEAARRRALGGFEIRKQEASDTLRTIDQMMEELEILKLSFAKDAQQNVEMAVGRYTEIIKSRKPHARFIDPSGEELNIAEYLKRKINTGMLDND